jgi:tetratricopeptide (TPR) repeat protein
MPAADWSGPIMSERVMACFVAAIVGLLDMGHVVSAQDAPKERANTPVSDADGMPASMQDNAQEQKLLEQLAAARKSNNNRQEVGVLGELGLFYFRNGQFKKSETQYLQALELGPNVLGANHPDLARANTNFGFVYEQTNDFRKAEPVLQKAMAILGTSRRDDSGLAKVVGALGDLYYAKGEFAKAVSPGKNISANLSRG